jgi:hypothetical protein
MTRSSTMSIQLYEYSGHLDFITLFVRLTMMLYAINSDVDSLFTNSNFFIFNDFQFVFVSNVFYQTK